MERFSFLGSVHASFVDELYQQYIKYPDSVEPSWRSFFQGYDFALEQYGNDAEFVVGDNCISPEIPEQIEKEFRVLDLINGYRTRGHLFTKTNPVRERRKYEPTLAIENFGLSSDDLDKSFEAGKKVGLDEPTKLRDIIAHLETAYCQSIGIEYMHIRKPEITRWIRQQIHINANQPNFNKEEKQYILQKLNEAVGFETFLNTKFVGQKRFSIEGAESMIPALDIAVRDAAKLGVKEIVMGMAHRGRLNVLSNIFGKTQRDIFSEFEGKEFEDEGFDGDVKYHLGYSTTKVLDDNTEVRLTLSPNPSHLEAVNPVVGGIARAKRDLKYDRDNQTVLPILIHGDAAIAGQGIVYEHIQMETLNGYSVGGTFHIVINNQVGFTTNYIDGRSSTYCTDVAKVIMAPVIHVNGDDSEAVVHAFQFAIKYRQHYNKEVFVDLLCYRKYGHNEGDEPRFTQPKLYKIISRHPNPRDIYRDKLLAEGVISDEYVSELEKDFKAMLEMKYDESKKIAKNKITNFLISDWEDYRESTAEDFNESPQTGVSEEKINTVFASLTTLPSDLKFIRKVEKLVNDRKNMVEDKKQLDWAMAELLAYGTLMQEGINVRLSGEDVERGTFSHRHAVMRAEESEERFIQLNTIRDKKAEFEAYNSLLSEYAVMAFDYGYSLATPKSLTLWEAQFGDFVNGAQITIDQFLSAAEDKWRVQSGLVLLLPHGYEGQGAEHSSARLERFLQLCAQDNMQVVNITEPANFFHALRRQLHRPFRKPLVVMSPKSLLRHPRCVSTIDRFTEGSFQEVLDDPQVKDTKNIKSLMFCSGKVYYELLAKKEEDQRDDVAIIRIEQLYPLPEKAINEVIERYPNNVKRIWVQEEPANMGANWFLKAWGLIGDFELVSPKASASPASGSNQAAVALQKRVIQTAFEKTNS
ncbi:MAG: 2-oxoglutarate dehydrogenase E1 component [Flavobacteriales bacterium]|nr:MAG: 2-oxoglutarate dehydrogenase E1 component [Flavobacteriales bacterium]